MEKIVIEIRDIEGGEDAKLLVKDMKSIYLKSIKNNNFNLDKIEDRDGTVNLWISGKRCKKFFGEEIGCHKFQRVPPTEKNGRVHTSVVSVAVLEEKQEQEVEIEYKDVQIIYTKGTGPGGQHKNKVETCVVLRHIPTNIQVKIDGRSRKRNEEEAWKELKKRLQDNLNKQVNNAYSQERRDQIGERSRSNFRRNYNLKLGIVSDDLTGKKTTFKNIQKGKIELLHI